MEIKTNIREMVRAQITMHSQPDREIRESLAVEFSAVLKEHNLQEAFLPSVQKLFAKGIDRYRFMFLEKGDTRWVFVREGGKVQAVEFLGNRKNDIVTFNNDADAEELIARLRSENFKPVTKDGSLARFFKPIMRAIGLLIATFGALNFLTSVVTLVMIVVMGPAAVGGTAAMAGTLVAYQSAAVGISLAVGLGGWMMARTSKRNFHADKMVATD